MIKKIILGVVLAIVILSSVVLANSSKKEDSRRDNVNCNNNCIYNEKCRKENYIMLQKYINNNCINQNCDSTRKQQRNQNCSNQNENYTQRQCKRMCQ